MITIVSVDGGLATSGLVAVRTDGDNHECVCADVFTSEPLAQKLDVELADDRVRRTRLLARWMECHLTRWAPNVVSAETMSFGARSHTMAVCTSLAWGVLCDQLELRRLPLVTAYPREWRTYLTKHGKERAAHREALRHVPSFRDRASRIPQRQLVHAFDALGVFVWSLSTNIVRAALGHA